MMPLLRSSSVRPVRCVRNEHGERANTATRKRAFRRSVAFGAFVFPRGERTNERSCIGIGTNIMGAVGGALSPGISLLESKIDSTGFPFFLIQASSP